MTSSISCLVGDRQTTDACVTAKGVLTLLPAEAIAECDVKDNSGCDLAHPCTVETDFVREFLKDLQRRAERLGEVPPGRMARVDDFASAIVCRASHEAAFIGEVALPVDGGLTAGEGE